MDALASVWSRHASNQPDLEVVFAIRGRSVDCAALCRKLEAAELNSRLRFLVDPDGKNAKRFNARWQRRAFAVEERGRLIYAQPPGTPDQAVSTEVSQLW